MHNTRKGETAILIRREKSERERERGGMKQLCCID